MKILKKKQTKIALLAIAAITFSVWLSGFILLKYENFKEIQSQKKKIEQIEKTIKNDTYGGKTPEETLRMFIDAVEAGDYELASKYFTVEKRKGEKLRLVNIGKQKKLKVYVDILRQLKPWRSSLNEDEFMMRSETDFGGPLFVYFIRYPSGIWKINEI